jgi:sorbitol-specific phosphotransferase system component IIBC
MIKHVGKAVISLVTILAILGSIFTLVVLAALITLFCEIPFMITFLGLSIITVLTIKIVINSTIGEINIDLSDEEDLKDHIG